MSVDHRARDRRTIRVGLALFLLTSVLYVATAGYHRVHIDVLSADVGAWRIAATGEPSIDGLDTSSINRTKVDLFSTVHDGRTVIARSPGVVAAGVPGYALRQWLTDAGPDAEDFTTVPPTVTAALLIALSVLLMWGALLQLTTRRNATAAALVLALATPVWSVAADGMWTHTLTVLGISGMAFGAARDRWLLVGLFGGIAVWGRPHTAMVAAAVALTCAWVQRRPGIAVRVVAVGAVLTFGASLWSYVLYGRWTPSGSYAPTPYLSRGSGSQYEFNQTVDGLLRNEAAMWFALDRGILAWTPVVVVLLPSLVRTWRTQPAWTRALLLAGIAYTLFQGAVAPFHGGDGIYGYRHGLEFLACATPALVVAATQAGSRTRAVFEVVVGVQLAAFALGGVLNRPTLTVGRQWDDNAFASALRDVPALWAWVTLCVGLVLLLSRMYLREADRVT
ncbi:hypothetical protein KVF89_03980 [Nocardioides carbamazepini]|uniref:hypothetical protein n=1 Tax=Nocardioides carbamazepini TaxID=2854259 RepID=UPI00214A1F24|nr:hypothetical protein [Nocardioides carbamazepini]MCR1781684.1 hypothetical protein [Nocardioides carbamazepini]